MQDLGAVELINIIYKELCSLIPRYDCIHGHGVPFLRP